ncbi:MAG: ribonuclease P protein component [Pseudomonadales bacterium]|nr:ribonuclease P protein component [Pseudomonadales bacterium]
MSSAGFQFGKQLRLLHARDYQQVFQSARYKVSCSQILVLAMDNNSPSPRLGLVIAKKHIKTAVARNRVKRLIRESFRTNQYLLKGLDIVILARTGLGLMANDQLSLQLDRLWHDLVQKRAKTTLNNSQVC